MRKLRVIAGESQDLGREFILPEQGGFTLGRSLQTDTKLCDVAVSGHHCRIEIDGSSVTLVDNGSRNGTFVGYNAASMTRLEASKPVELRDGMQIRLGIKTVFAYTDEALHLLQTVVPPREQDDLNVKATLAPEFEPPATTVRQARRGQAPPVPSLPSAELALPAPPAAVPPVPPPPAPRPAPTEPAAFAEVPLDESSEFIISIGRPVPVAPVEPAVPPEEPPSVTMRPPPTMRPPLPLSTKPPPGPAPASLPRPADILAPAARPPVPPAPPAAAPPPPPRPAPLPEVPVTMPPREIQRQVGGQPPAPRVPAAAPPSVPDLAATMPPREIQRRVGGQPGVPLVPPAPAEPPPPPVPQPPVPSVPDIAATLPPREPPRRPPVAPLVPPPEPEPPRAAPVPSVPPRVPQPGASVPDLAVTMPPRELPRRPAIPPTPLGPPPAPASAVPPAVPESMWAIPIVPSAPVPPPAPPAARADQDEVLRSLMPDEPMAYPGSGLSAPSPPGMPAVPSWQSSGMPVPSVPPPLATLGPPPAPKGPGTIGKLGQLVGGLVSEAVASLGRLFHRPGSGSQITPGEPWQALAASLRRNTDVSFPAEVYVGVPSTLRIQLVPAEEALPGGGVRAVPLAHEHDVVLQLQAPPGQGTRVRVCVAAENFQFQGPAQAELIVPAEGRSTPVQFQLVAQRLGVARVMIDFMQEGHHVGSVDLRPRVIADTELALNEQARGTGEVCLGRGDTPPPDVILKVFEYRSTEGPGRLHFQLYSEHPALRDLPVYDGDMGSLDLRSELSVWVAEQLSVLTALSQGGGFHPEEMDRTLSRMGYNLFDKLLPRPVQDLYWTLCQRGIKSIMVLSDEPHIPWELIKPYRRDPVRGTFQQGEPFWGERFVLTHWLRGRPPAPQVSLRHIIAVAAGPGGGVRDMRIAPGAAAPGMAPLSGVQEEVESLRALERGGTRVEVIPARRDRIHAVLQQGGFDVFHLACHGSFGGTSNAEASAVRLEDGLFQVAELSPELAVSLRRTAPLVFLNACHTGRLGFSLTRLGSWGARLLELGCGGFVGTLWPVADRAAVAFARSFYQALAAGQGVGEAVWVARLEVHRQFPGDPTWLAYCCFAEPHARSHHQAAPVMPLNAP